MRARQRANRKAFGRAAAQRDMEAAGLALGLVVLALVLICVQVPIFGFGPLWLKQVWVRIIRLAKRGDERTWNWTEIEANLYVGSLPRSTDNLKELKAICHCGTKATMVVRFDESGQAVTKGSQIEIGGNDRYVSMCRKHFKEKFFG